MDALETRIGAIDLAKEERLEVPKTGDATAAFFSAVQTIPVGHVVKSPIFPLLHGTHALEVGNPRLDSYLLPQVDYVKAELDENAVLGLATGLLRALTCWLCDNVSLSNTVLGYEPLCDVLDKYTETRGLAFLGKKGSWDDVLDSIIVGVVGCVKFVLNCGLQGVVYDDEDLTTRTMDLDWFHDVPTDIIVEVLTRVRTWTSNRTLLDIVDVLECWISCEDLLSLNLRLLQQSETVIAFQRKLDATLETLAHLKSTHHLGTAPPNAFNTNALRKYNNFIPPKPVVQSSWGNAVINLEEMFQDLSDVLTLTSLGSVLELREWFHYLRDKRHNHSQEEVLGLHVVPRMVLQLFFVRDDESILGDQSLNLGDLLWLYMKSTTMANSVLDIHQTHFQEQLDQIVQNLKVPFSQCLTGASQNPSRQRQILAKNTLFWDKFQAEFPQVELDLNKIIPDVSSETQAPLMPLTGFIYYEKLDKMVCVILKSIELRLFKDVRELTMGYFVLIYVVDHMLNHLEGLSALAQYRQHQIEAYPKRIKKLSGEKKAKLKAQYDLVNSQAPSIAVTLQYYKYRTNWFNIIKALAEVKLTTLQVLCSIGFAELPPLAAKRVSPALLYSLQWKPFNSIGTPSMPLYTEVESSLNSFSATFKSLLDQGKASRINILVEDNMKRVSAMVTENEEIIANLKWAAPLVQKIKADNLALKRATVTSKLELSKIGNLITPESSKSTLNLNINYEHHHRYFPGLDLSPV